MGSGSLIRSVEVMHVIGSVVEESEMIGGGVSDNGDFLAICGEVECLVEDFLMDRSFIAEILELYVERGTSNCKST